MPATHYCLDTSSSDLLKFSTLKTNRTLWPTETIALSVWAGIPDGTLWAAGRCAQPRALSKGKVKQSNRRDIEVSGHTADVCRQKTGTALKLGTVLVFRPLYYCTESTLHRKTIQRRKSRVLGGMIENRASPRKTEDT